MGGCLFCWTQDKTDRGFARMKRDRISARSWGSRFQNGRAEFADAAVGADYEGEREGVPVAVFGNLVGAGGERGVGMESAPVAAIVGGDVGAVGAYGDPGFVGGGVGYGGAVAVGWCGGGCPMQT